MCNKINVAGYGDRTLKKFNVCCKKTTVGDSGEQNEILLMKKIQYIKLLLIVDG